MQSSIAKNSNVVSFIDLGSNSVRMIIVKIFPNGGTSLLHQAKQMVQLGRGAFIDNVLQKDAMERTLQVLYSFSLTCKSYNVTEINAVATCAVRDAANGQEFLNAIQNKSGIVFNCISGDEEARLIYRGVSESFEKSSMIRLYLDIGGGSTEFVVGDSYSHKLLESVKLGCVRMANAFVADKSGRITDSQYIKMQNYVRDVAKHSFARIITYNIKELIASSGTAQNLSLISAHMEHGQKLPEHAEFTLSYKNMVRTIKHLRSLTDEQRKTVFGINPKRIDLIVPGAVILQTVTEELGFDEIKISIFGLRDGLLREYLEKNYKNQIDETASVQERSVLKLARACRFEEEHARHVAKVSLRLFDSAKVCCFHDMNKSFRDLLYFSALLHDIGIFISFSKHDLHGKYLIMHHPLIGFNSREINLIANLVGNHRIKNTKEISNFEELGDDVKQQAEKLCIFLKIAEILDKSHGKYINDATFIEERGQIKLQIIHSEPCPIEQEKMEQTKKLLKKISGKEIGLNWILRKN